MTAIGPIAEIQAGALHRRVDHRQCLDAYSLQGRLHAGKLQYPATAERAVQSTTEANEETGDHASCRGRPFLPRWPTEARTPAQVLPAEAGVSGLPWDHLANLAALSSVPNHRAILPLSSITAT